MLEIKKTELKKRMYEKEDYLLMVDSFTNQEINADFQAIDKGLYFKLKKFSKKKPKTFAEKIEDNFISNLMQGNKISLGVA